MPTEVRSERMPEERVELSWGCPRRILSPLRLPFRHSGRSQRAKYTLNNAAATEQRVAAAASCNELLRSPGGGLRGVPDGQDGHLPCPGLCLTPALPAAPSAARQLAA